MKRLIMIALVACLSFGVASVSSAQEGTGAAPAGAEGAKHHKKKHTKKKKKSKKAEGQAGEMK